MWRSENPRQILYRRTTRIVVTALFFVGVFIFPWWLWLLLGVFLLFFYQSYEVLLGALFSDLLYGTASPFLGGLPFLTTGIFVLMTLAVFLVHRRLLV